MAIIKMSPPRQGKPGGLFFLIRYIMDDKKTDLTLVSGHNFNPKTAYKEMLLTKENWHKLDGRQYCHFIQSFNPKDSITPEQAHRIGQRLLAEFSQFDGFEVVMATHRNRNHIHNHFALNSVNADTGLKWQQKAQDLYRLKEFSNKLCAEYNLSQIPLGTNKQNQSYGEWVNRKAGISWKAQLESDIRECLAFCRNRAEFLHAMADKGYQINWTNERKYVTFTTPDGLKCRNSKLSDIDFFSKENMQNTLNNNAADLSLLRKDPDVFIDAMRLACGVLYPNSPNELQEAYLHRDLSHLEHKELLIAIRQLKTEDELKKIRRQNQTERDRSNRQFSQTMGNLADEFEHWIQDEDLEI